MTQSSNEKRYYGSKFNSLFSKYHNTFEILSGEKFRNYENNDNSKTIEQSKSNNYPVTTLPFIRFFSSSFVFIHGFTCTSLCTKNG